MPPLPFDLPLVQLEFPYILEVFVVHALPKYLRLYVSRGSLQLFKLLLHHLIEFFHDFFPANLSSQMAGTKSNR